jgi:hypothetical protein
MVRVQLHELEGSWSANTSGFGEGRADATRRSGADRRARGRVPGSGRTTSSVRTTRRVMGRSTVESVLTPSTCVHGAARSCASRVGSRVSCPSRHPRRAFRRRHATGCLHAFAAIINSRAAPVLAKAAWYPTVWATVVIPFETEALQKTELLERAW